MTARRVLFYTPEAIAGVDEALVNPAISDLAGLVKNAEAVIWWAAGAPLGSQAQPIQVHDHLRLLAGEPALIGPHFVAMHHAYDLDLGRALLDELGLKEWENGIVADVPHATALSPAERAMLAGMGAHWAIRGATAATIAARQKGLPVAGFACEAETLEKALRLMRGRWW
ncbi:hypothetical protein HS125_04860 [bacterium]|nr:hypothetical protein [bacterium]